VEADPAPVRLGRHRVEVGAQRVGVGRGRVGRVGGGQGRENLLMLLLPNPDERCGLSS
jgi:hypothetical protein